MFSRNAASSRAIPINTMIKNILADPVFPTYWGMNKAGMQASEEIDEDYQLIARGRIEDHLNTSVELAKSLSDLYRVEEDGKIVKIGLHKQIVNRYLEPWMWITVIVSATEWDNFFHLRCHPDAQPEIQKIAYMMEELYHTHAPTERTLHLPLIYEEDQTLSIAHLKMVSVGRCARVSYLTHDGRRDPTADIELCTRLIESGHWSPFEHVAVAAGSPDQWSGNLRGWNQYRKEFKNENFIRSLGISES
jgi:hypothetical protein